MTTIGAPTGVYRYGFYPTDPYIGMCIFDSTFGKVLYWYGPALGWQYAWNLEWGWVADIQLAGTFSVSLPEGDITGLTLSWAVMKNRKYLIQMNIRYSSQPESVGTSVYLTDGSNTHTNEITMSNGSSGNNAQEITLTERYLATFSGTITRKGRAAKSAPADTKTLGPDNSIR